MNLFGEPWNEMTKALEQVQIPIGEKCAWCDEEFIENDQGLEIPHLGEVIEFRSFHKNCFLREIVGSLGHQQKKCSCHGGDTEDPPEMSIREAANAAVDFWMKQNQD